MTRNPRLYCITVHGATLTDVVRGDRSPCFSWKELRRLKCQATGFELTFVETVCGKGDLCAVFFRNLILDDADLFAERTSYGGGSSCKNARLTIECRMI